MLLHYPETQIITLDDDSERSTNVKNIYNLMGFSFVGDVSLDVGEKTLSISGPSKVLTIERFNNILTTGNYPLVNIKKNNELNLKFIEDWNEIRFSRVKKRKTRKRSKSKFRNIV